MCNALKLESKVMTLLLCLIDDNCRKQSCNNCEYRTNSSGELKEHEKSNEKFDQHGHAGLLKKNFFLPEI